MFIRNFRRLGMAAALAVACAPAAAQASFRPGLEAQPFGSRTELYVSGGYNPTDGGTGAFSASNLYTYASPHQLPTTITGLAQASLAGGTLKASSVVTTPTCVSTPFSSCSPGVGVVSSAAMWDTVQFVQEPGGEIENISLMPISLAIDGRLAGDPSARAEVRYYWGWDRDIDVETLDWVSLSETETNIFDVLVIPSPTQQYDPMFIYAELRTYAGTTGQFHTFSLADFGNTLHFNWEVPEGLIAQSASGAFMTDLTSAVPEPGAWAMMIVGFGLVGGTLRRRREAPAA